MRAASVMTEETVVMMVVTAEMAAAMSAAMVEGSSEGSRSSSRSLVSRSSTASTACRRSVSHRPAHSSRRTAGPVASAGGHLGVERDDDGGYGGQVGHGALLVVL
eukprot:7378337-Prymnesium_polylepis.1